MADHATNLPGVEPAIERLKDRMDAAETNAKANTFVEVVDLAQIIQAYRALKEENIALEARILFLTGARP